MAIGVRFDDEANDRAITRARALTTPMRVSDIYRAVRATHPTFPLDTYQGIHLRRVLGQPGDRRSIREQCRQRCQQVRWGVWVLDIQTSGTRIAVLRCLVCGSSMCQIGADKLGIDPPLWADGTQYAEPCARCGSTNGTEVHHWAPRHLFDDADAWPTSPLCPTCHREWHRVVTPKMGQHLAS